MNMPPSPTKCPNYQLTSKKRSERTASSNCSSPWTMNQKNWSSAKRNSRKRCRLKELVPAVFQGDCHSPLITKGLSHLQKALIIMEQEQRIQEEEQLIDQSAEAADQESAEMAEEEHSEQDELMPRPAFYIEEDAENLTEEERQAFSYILAVRTQKENLLLSRKRQHPRRQEEIESEKIQYKNEKEDLKEQERTGEAVYQQLMSWNKELISNWKCVISNMKYLHKNKLPQNLVRQKLSMECLFTMPEINRICHNKWLTLPQIQNLLIFLSNAKYQALELHMESNQQMPTSDHYHLWIYSLLALHQSYASYNNFEALASVNACLLKQRTYLKGLIGQGREVEVDRVIGWGATLVLLVEAFNQRFLKSHFTLMKMIK